MQRWTNLSTEDKTKRINLQDALEMDLLEYSISKYWRGIDHDITSGPADGRVSKSTGPDGRGRSDALLAAHLSVCPS